MNKIPVKVQDGRNAANKYSRSLIRYYKLSCIYENGYIYTGTLSAYKTKQLKKFCKEKNIKFEIDTKYGKRSSSYRNNFFNNVKSPLPNHYFCAYCGKILSLKNVTIDHLYPVGEVDKNINLQNKLKRIGANSVNDYQNLVPACKKCNNKKGTKMGLWIIKGEIGRHQRLWIFRWTLRLLFLVLFIMIGLMSYSYLTIDFIKGAI